MWENLLNNHFGLEHKNQFVFLEHCLNHSAQAIHALSMPKTPDAFLPLPQQLFRSATIQLPLWQADQSIKIDLCA